jgi:VWFA-related protein
MPGTKDFRVKATAKQPEGRLAGLAWVALLITVCIALPLGGPAGAQTAPSTTPATTIVRNVDEVSLDLVVRGKKNKPVLNLTSQDLAVSDAGTPVRLSSLRLVDQKAGSRLLTLVFDRFDSVGGVEARKIALKILKQVPYSGFALSVLKVQDRLGLVQGFTADRARLLPALEAAAQGGPGQAAGEDVALKGLLAAVQQGKDISGAPITARQRLRAEVLLRALQDAQYIEREQHPAPSLAGLLALVRSERRLPGLKVIFFITQDSSLRGRGAVARIVSSANRAGVKMFVIDANSKNDERTQYLRDFATMRTAMSLETNYGVVLQTRGPPVPPPNVVSPQAPRGPMGDLNTQGMLAIQKTHYDRLDIPGEGQTEPVCQLADATGGRCVQAGGNPEKVVRRLVQDMAAYYEASFVPDVKQYDGKFHRVTVKLLRGGMKIKSPSGYFALPPEAGLDTQAFEAPLRKVLEQPTLPQQLQFEARVLQLGELANGNTSALVVEVPVSQLATRDDPNTNLYSSDVAILAQLKDQSGEVVQHFAEDIPQHGSLDQKQRGAAESVRLQESFVADPGKYVLETAVLDRNSGKVSAQRSSFELGQASRAPFVSDLSLVARMDPLPEETDAGEPMRYGNGKVVPDLSDDIGKGRKQISIFSILYADAQAQEKPQLEITLLRDGERVGESPLPLRAGEAAAGVPYLASFAANSLPPGNYEAVETLRQGKATAEKRLAFRIAGPELASAANSTTLGTRPATADIPRPISGALESKEAGKSSPLVISTLPPAAVIRPSPEALREMIGRARKYALTYSRALPNFLCIEVTKRSVDSSGRGEWKMRDSFAEMLRYDGHEESRTLLEWNGQRMGGQHPTLDSALPVSVGQFEGVLNVVFQPASKTSFEWQGAALLGSDAVQVLRYAVSGAYASMALRESGRVVNVGFHGAIYVDAATGGIRKITLEADDIPRNFPIRGAGMTVEYDYVTIGAHDYLVPMRAALSLRRGSRKRELNEIVFRNYRRFAAQTRIVPVQ